MDLDPDPLAAVDDEDDDLRGGYTGGEDEQGEEPGDQTGFRNIPTWQEAIGTIVAVNMESREAPRQRRRGPRTRLPRSTRRPPWRTTTTGAVNTKYECRNTKQIQNTNNQTCGVLVI